MNTTTKSNTNKMAGSQQASATLVSTIIEAILDKKGQDVVVLDLTNLPDALTNYFIVCQGSSSPQVRAIADNVQDEVKEKLHERPVHTEGYENLQWVLIDFADVVLHVFREDLRSVYQLEDLWADADNMTLYKTDGTKESIKNYPPGGWAKFKEALENKNYLDND